MAGIQGGEHKQEVVVLLRRVLLFLPLQLPHRGGSVSWIQRVLLKARGGGRTCRRSYEGDETLGNVQTAVWCYQQGAWRVWVCVYLCLMPSLFVLLADF